MRRTSISIRRAIALSATNLTALAATLCLFLIGYFDAANAAPPNFPRIPAGGKARGEAALARLGDRLPQVAAFYGKTAPELRELFRRDSTLWIDAEGTLLYICEMEPPPAQAEAVANGAEVAEGPFPANQTFFLHSRPGATKVIYLDFNGHVTSGTSWNSSYRSGQDIVTPPFDTDGNPSTFSAAELDRIQYIWQRVTEDFAPFDVDVTTQDPGVDALRKSSSTDATYGTRVCIGGSSADWYNGSSGGVAYIGSFSWNSDTPCFVFPAQLGGGAEKYTADAASHEAGHTLGLNHDGVTGGTAYYAGHNGWAPIMGLGYYVELTHWSRGEYSQANNTQDDLATFQNYGVNYRTDDHGNTIASATPLYGSSVSASGVIERRTDVDVFSFQTGAGTIQFTVNPTPRAPNLDILVTLHDGSGNLLASANPASLNATLSATVATGTYYLLVDGVGAGDFITGYSDYASLGQYTITGTLIPTGALQPPVPVASASPVSGIAPLTVNFSSAGSMDPDGTIINYDWELENGVSSSLPNPSHVYSSAGVYNVLLIVTDNQGLSRSATVTITVNVGLNQPPVAFASATPTTGYAPLAVNFYDAGSYDPDGTIVSYLWNFGDGGTSTAADPAHTYVAAGTYRGSLTVTDNQGASNTMAFAMSVLNGGLNQSPVASASATPTTGYAPLAVNFSSSGSYDPDGTIASYSWNFGDGGTSTAANPAHTYVAAGTYTGSLTVTDNQGASNTKAFAMSVLNVGLNQPPVAFASATPTTGYAPLAVNFYDAGSYDPDGTIVSYLWNFGDGGTSTAADPAHTYVAAGTYRGSLTVTDNQGASNTMAFAISVLNGGLNQSPVASASATPTTGYAPLAVNFSSSGSYDPDGTIASYSWNFGDGGTSTAANPAHTYVAAGTYTGSLTVTDNQGASNTKAFAMSVLNVGLNQPPVAFASATPTTGYAPLAVNFYDAGSYDPDGTIVSYLWNFGDGGTSTAADPAHTYVAAGTYRGSLTVTDNQGASNTMAFAISILQDSIEVVFVNTITMTLQSAPSGTAARAEVEIVDGAGVPRPNATVSGNWTGLTTDSVTGTTDASGKVSFLSTKVRTSGTYSFTITSVSAPGYSYDPSRNVKTSDSISR